MWNGPVVLCLHFRGLNLKAAVQSWKVWLSAVARIIDSHVVSQRSSGPGAEVCHTLNPSMRLDLLLSQTIDVYSTKERRGICTLYQEVCS